ncbi:MAG: DNA replication and repair protein RecF [Saprospiraceae bacterium]
MTKITALHLEKIKLTHFKNYTVEELSFSSKLNCFVGKNGMGKTNLLDAIYYLCMCKSSTSINDRNVMQRETDFFRVEGHFKINKKKHNIVAKVIPGKRKEFEQNAVPYKTLLEHIGLIPVVMIIPDDTELAKEGSEVRRKFLDNTLSQSDSKYLENLILYNRVLKQRNTALKHFAKQHSFDRALIDTFNEQMLEPAKYIIACRAAFIETFSPIFENYYKVISGDQENVRCEYNTQLIGKDFIGLLEETMGKDRTLQRTTVGIHKDDLRFYIDDFPLKKFASQGQLKSFVLAVKLAQYEFLKKLKNKRPILLLDDIFDKLDNDRVEQLIGLLVNGDFGQVFITDTHEKRIEEIIEKFGTDFKKFIIEFGIAKTQ